MKILHTESSVNWGGQELRTIEQMRWLLENGHETALAARPGSDIKRRAEEKGLAVFPVQFSGQYSPRAIFQARAIVREHGFEVADCHGGRDAMTMAFVQDLCAIVRTRHITQPLKGKWRRRWQWTYGCSHVIATAWCVKDGLAASRMTSPDRISVVGEWAGEEFFDISKREQYKAEVFDEFSIPRRHFLAATIGMLRQDKAQERLIYVAAEMKKRGRPMAVMIVGSGVRQNCPYEQGLYSLARSLGVKDLVFFTGYRDDIARLTQACDALVITSSLEAQSRTAPQGFASMTPVVASRVGGIPELVRPGETGWLAAPDDIQGYALALLEIMDHPEKARGIVERARGFAEGNLRIGAKMAQTLSIYRSIVKAH